VAKFKRTWPSSKGLSSDASLPSQATNAWTLGASDDDVSTLGGVVQTVDSTNDALSPGIVRVY
jgi:hypothetical protein